MGKKTIEQVMAELNDIDSGASKLWREVGLSKVDSISDYVVESVKDSPVLLGCWHRDVMSKYAEQLAAKGLTVAQVHGDTKNTETIRNAFNNGSLDVLIGQMRKMGVAWNIQETCNHVVVAEAHPSNALLEQFYKRVVRRGQQRKCTVDYILAEQLELDELLLNVARRKKQSDLSIRA